MKILFVNPPIYDFSAYDFWLKPYGLLRIAGYLRDSAEITFFDFMDRNSRFLPSYTKSKADGRGSYLSIPVEKPAVYNFVKRHYQRFGVPETAFIDLLQSNDFDLVFITSAMTYWYLGIKEVIKNVRCYLPKAKIVLGGIYATLCYEHAKTLGVDYILPGGLEKTENLNTFCELTKAKPNFDAIPYWEGYDKLDYGILKLNDGCPLSCSYCSARQFYPIFKPRHSAKVLDELDLIHSRGARNIAFYDDALLVGADKTLFPFLESVKEKYSDEINFHTPNAMHIKLISEDTAQKLKHFGFRKLFLGFESISDDWQHETGGKAGNKTNCDELKVAVKNLKQAGFKGNDITAYLIAGHPKQTEKLVADSINFVTECGIHCMLAEYSPIPGTPDGELCKSYVDLSEPLNQNSSVFPLYTFGAEKMQRLKDLCRGNNLSIK